MAHSTRQLRTSNSGAGRLVLALSEVDGHAVVGSRQIGVGEPAEHGSRHVGEHDPFGVQEPYRALRPKYERFLLP